jgi:hypothetical protein
MTSKIVRKNLATKIRRKPLNQSAKKYKCFDQSAIKPTDIWHQDPAIRKKTLFIARKAVIDLFKTLGQLPKDGRTVLIPHPAKPGEFVSNRQFSKPDEVINSDDRPETRWTLLGKTFELRIIAPGHNL